MRFVNKKGKDLKKQSTKLKKTENFSFFLLSLLPVSFTNAIWFRLFLPCESAEVKKANFCWCIRKIVKYLSSLFCYLTLHLHHHIYLSIYVLVFPHFVSPLLFFHFIRFFSSPFLFFLSFFFIKIHIAAIWCEIKWDFSPWAKFFSLFFLLLLSFLSSVKWTKIAFWNVKMVNAILYTYKYICRERRKEKLSTE